MRSLFACGLSLLLASGLQACCFRTGNTDAATTAAPVGPLQIVNWGPRQTRAGVPFNAQSSGHAAIWIRVNQPVDDWATLIQFDDAFLGGNAKGSLITATVPEASYAKPGGYEVRVIVGTADAHWSSNKVTFTVE